MATTIETDLKEVLERIDKRLGSLESDMTTLKVDMATVKTELTLTREDVKDIKGRATAQIWTLIGLIATIITAIVATVVKFGFFPNP
jgi:hypothetical protein